MKASWTGIGPQILKTTASPKYRATVMKIVHSVFGIRLAIRASQSSPPFPLPTTLWSRFPCPDQPSMFSTEETFPFPTQKKKKKEKRQKKKKPAFDVFAEISAAEICSSKNDESPKNVNVHLEKCRWLQTGACAMREISKNAAVIAHQLIWAGIFTRMWVSVEEWHPRQLLND